MTEAWKRWEGQVVGGNFPLRQYLGGSERSAVFLTARNRQKAAIKLIPADLATAELTLARWKRAAQLSHPHLLQLFEMEMGRCRIDNVELLFVVEEYAEENLSQILPERPLTLAELREMLPPVLSALASLHGQGFVHGHLKPANIMAAGDQLKLSSDGLCRMGDSRVGNQPSAYDPPESAAGSISPAGDVWSLGMTLSEALTQKLPVCQGTEREPLLPAGLPAEFFDLVERCVRRDPQQRWTIDEIAARLRQPSAAPRARMPVPRQKAQTVPQIRRFLVPAVVIILVLAAVVGGRQLLNRTADIQSDAQTGAASASDQPGVAAKPQKPKASKPKPSAQASRRERLASASSATSPPSAGFDVDTQSKGRGLTEDDVVEQVLPDVAQEAKDTIHGRFWVSVRVQVDSSGDVVGAEIASQGPSEFFAKSALQAARDWKFLPSNSRRRQGILQFQFEHGSITALPVR